MSTIVTRAGKGSTLTFAEVDANFTNLNTDKLEFSSEPVRHSVRPSLLLDFANTKQLDPRITFTRASTATFYDGRTTALAEQNLLLQSQTFETTWGVTNTSVTANSTTAPDGTTTADTLTALVGTGARYIAQNTSAYTGAVTISLYAKAGTQNFIQILGASDAQAFANFNITTGSGVVGTKGSKTTSSIVDAGNGWYRCVVNFDNTVSASSEYRIYMVASASAAFGASITAAGTETVFLWGAQLEQRSSVTAYTPTTTAAITNYIPALQTAASGVARFDHNPTTGESLGLLIEEQRVNLLTYSEQFDNGAWSKSNTTISANTIIAPDGTLIGDKLIEDTAASTHFVTRTISSLTGAYTFSVFVKRGERTFVTVAESASTATRATFNLSNGTIFSQPSGTGATITDAGNGWYRCSITATLSSQTFGCSVFLSTDGTTYQSYTGNGFAGIYVWGAQLEAGAFATSYIPTVASQVTRSPDAASMTGTNFSSWYRQDAGTFYSEANDSNGINNAHLTAYADGNNIVEFRGDGSLNKARLLIKTNGTFVINTLSTTSTQPIKQAASFTNGSVSSTANGALFVTNVNVQTPKLLTTLLIGEGITASVKLNGAVKKIAYYPKSLTNAELQGLTTV